MSSRATQKKLSQILRDLLKEIRLKCNVDDMGDLVEKRPPCMKAFDDEDHLISYGEDIFQFKRDMDESLVVLGKINGRKKEIEDVKRTFSQLLDRHFEGVFPPPVTSASKGAEADETVAGGRKRGRVSTGSEDGPAVSTSSAKTVNSAVKPGPKKRKGLAAEEEEEEDDDDDEPTGEPMSAEQLTALKTIVTGLMKLDDAEPFLRPVDKNAFPEYYAVIEHPTDLSTIKKKLGNKSFATVQEALEECRLLWGNCKSFNAEGSDIYDTAERLGKAFEKEVYDLLGKEYSLKKAPGRKPKAYSVPEKAEKEVKAEKSSKSSKVTIKEEESAGVSGPIEVNKKFFQGLLKGFKKHELIEPFLDPVDVDAIPGYADMIKQPMDITTVETKLKGNLYGDNLQSFESDINLIFSNCMTYNDPASELYAWAKSLQQYSDGVFTGVKKQLADQEKAKKAAKSASAPSATAAEVKKEPAAKTAATPSAAPAVKPESASKPAATASAPSLGQKRLSSSNAADDGDDEDSPPLAVTLPAGVGELVPTYHDVGLPIVFKPTRKDRKFKRQELTYNSMKMWKVTKNIYSHPLSRPLQNIDDYPADYYELIENPLDFDTIRSRLDQYELNPSQFYADLNLVFDNYLKYHSGDVVACEQANELRRLCDHWYKEQKLWHLPSSVIPKSLIAPFAAPKEATRPVISSEPKASGTVRPIPPIPVSFPLSGGSILHTDALAKRTQLFERLFGSSGAHAASSSEDAKEDNSFEYSHLRTLEPSAIQALLAAVEGDVDCTSDPVVTKAARIAKQRAIDLQLEEVDVVPYITEDRMYEVHYFGEVSADPHFFSSTFLYPKDYKCKVYARLYIVPHASSSDESGQIMDVEHADESHAHPPFVKVEVINSISQSNPPGRKNTDKTPSVPKFDLYIDGVGTLVTGADSPDAAWKELLPQGNKVLAMLGSRLRRCRAVFNQLCCHPDIFDFLEPVTLADYYKIIKAPMWLKEVHNRLAGGTYDNEFDFAWDMRLVFTNCMQYNAKESEIYQTAENLLNLFEQLMCQWVHNVQDHNLDDLAKGSWDQWRSLRYFDEGEIKRSVCRLTGQVATDDELVFCNSCEDQFLPAALGMEAPPTGAAQKSWVCTRCKELDLLAGTADPLATLVENYAKVPAVYHKEQYGGYFFAPNPDLGVGWSQARTKNRVSTRNTFLSPLGYIVHSKEEVLAQQEFEAVVHANLLKARETEYAESKGLTKKGAKQKGRHKRQVSSPIHRRSHRHADDEDVEVAQPKPTAPEHVDVTVPVDGIEEEPGLLVYGKLCDYQVPEGHIAVWCVDALLPSKRAQQEQFILADTSKQEPEPEVEPDKIASKFVLTESTLPEAGLFGLDHPEIRVYLEGRAEARKCKGYQFYDGPFARKELIADLHAIGDRKFAMQKAMDNVQVTLLRERWHWDRDRITSRRVGIVDSSASKPSSPPNGFVDVFPPSVDTEEANKLLCIWDFLETLSYNNLGRDLYVSSFSLQELIHAMAPKVGLVPTQGQTNFDEMSMIFIEILLCELKYVIQSAREPISASTQDRDVDEMKFQRFLQYKPLNILTWPEVALASIHFHTLAFDCFTLETNIDKSTVPWDYNFPLDQKRARVYDRLRTEHTDDFHDQVAKFMFLFPSITSHPVSDFVTILFSHPYIPYVSQPVFRTGSQLKDASIDVAEQLMMLRSNYLSTEYMFNFATVDDFAAALYKSAYLIFRTAVAASVRGGLFHALASELLEFVTGIFKDWGIDTTDIISSQSDEMQDDDAGQETDTATSSPPLYLAINNPDISQQAWYGHLLSPFIGVEDSYPLYSPLQSPSYPFPNKLPSILSYSSKQKFLDEFEGGLIRVKLKVVKSLQTTLHLLRRTDPEKLTRLNRYDVLCTLVDQVSRTLPLRALVFGKQDIAIKVAHKWNSVLDVGIKPSGDMPPMTTLKVDLRHKESLSSYSCHYTKAEARQMDHVVSWVTVPEWLLSPPGLPALPSGTETSQLLLQAYAVASQSGANKKEESDGTPTVGESLSAEATSTADESKEQSLTINTDEQAEEEEAAVSDNEDGDKASRPGRSSRTPRVNYSISRQRSSRKENGHTHSRAAVEPPSHPVAIESIATLVTAAREAALREKLRLAERVTALATQLGNPDQYNLIVQKDLISETTKAHMLVRPRAPLGFDSQGREYWLLGIQEVMTVMPLTPVPSKSEPNVLMRDLSGRWFYHEGRQLDKLVNSFSTSIPCERLLRENMVERLFFMRRKFNFSYMRHRQSQLVWMQKFANCRLSTENYQLAEIDTPQYFLDLELKWARCAEVRGLLYYSFLFRDDEDRYAQGSAPSFRAEKDAQFRRQRRIKEYFTEDCFDFNTVHGWMKDGAALRIKSLFASSVASRLLAEPTLYVPFKNSCSVSVMRRTMFSLPPPPRAITAGSAAASSDVAESKSNAKSSDYDDDDDDEEEEAKQSEAEAKKGVFSSPLSASAHDRPSTGIRTKHVQLCHIVTGEVLRTFYNQKDATTFLGVSQAAISQACSGLRKDAYGFKWQFYEGPPIDWKELEKTEASREEIMRMLTLRGRNVAGEIVSSSAQEADEGSNDQAAPSLDNTTSATASAPMETDIDTAKETGDDKSAPTQEDPVSASAVVPVPSTTPVLTRSSAQHASSTAPAAPTVAAAATTAHPSAPVGTMPTISIDTTYRFSGVVKQLPHMAVALKPQSVRLMKIKSEFMAIVYAVPDRLMRYPPTAEELKAMQAGTGDSSVLDVGMDVDDGDDDDAMAVEATETAAPVKSTTDSSDTAKPEEESKDETKSENDPKGAAWIKDRKRRRKIRRQFYNEKILTTVQEATTPDQVLEMVDLFEAALPPWAFASFEAVNLQTKILSSKKISSSSAAEKMKHDVTCAYLATRVFILDRCIRYEEMRSIDKHLYGQEKTLRPRIHFTPKCYVIPNCVRTLCHDGRCVPSSEIPSRLPQLAESTPPPWVLGTNLPGGGGMIISNTTNNLNAHYAAQRLLASAAAGPGLGTAGTYYSSQYNRPGVRYTAPTQPNYIYELARRTPELFDLEGMQPYVPVGTEILKSEWV